MKIIFFSLSIIALILSLGISLTYDTNPAYAQVEIENIETLINETSDSKTFQIDDNIFKFESKTPQVFDGIQWTNYVFSDNPTYIRFESEGIAVDFFKDTCAFRLYETGLIAGKQTIIESLSHTIARDSIDLVTTCNVSPVTSTSDSISFDTISSDGITKLVTKYNINYVKGIEWTFEPENLDIKNSTISITDSCYKCIPDKTEGDKVYFGDYIYDTKNNEIDPFTGINKGHETLTEQKTIGEDFSFKYETIIKPNEKKIIDPTFSSNNPTDDAYVTDTGNNDICDTGSSKVTGGTDLEQTVYGTASATDCRVSYFDYDISSIPAGSIVTDVDFAGEIFFIFDARTCDYISLGTIRATDTAANLMGVILNGTEMLSNDSTCSATGINLSVDFGTVGNSEVQTRVTAGSGFFTFGTRLDNLAADAANHGSGYGAEERANTPDPTLTIVYSAGVFSAGPPLNPAATNNQVRQINFTWTTNNATGVTGYAVWNSSNNNTIPDQWQSLANTGNFTGDTGFYLHTGLANAARMYYKASAMGGNNGTNSTVAAGYTAGNASAPTLVASVFSSTRIDYISTAGSSNGNSTVKDYGLRCEVNSVGGWLDTVANSTLPANRSYNYTGLSSGDSVTCQWRDGNSVGFSDWSNNATEATGQFPASIMIFDTNMTGDALQVIPNIRLTAGLPAQITLTNIQILRNGTSINNTAISLPISIGQTISLGRSFVEQLNENFVYNITGVLTTSNSTGALFTSSNYTELPVVYTANYFESSEGNYQINYTTSRTNAFATLNLVVSRQNLPANTECNYKDELFEAGDWVNETNSGWYNQSVTVVPTKNIYVTCYNDQLLFAFTSDGGNNATLAFVDYMNQLGTFAGVPLPFLFILLLAAVFTGRSAITGIIFVAITIGVMGTMGFLPDINGNPSISAATWGFIVFLCAIGVFAGKKYF